MDQKIRASQNFIEQRRKGPQHFAKDFSIKKKGAAVSLDRLGSQYQLQKAKQMLEDTKTCEHDHNVLGSNNRTCPTQEDSMNTLEYTHQHGHQNKRLQDFRDIYMPFVAADVSSQLKNNQLRQLSSVSSIKHKIDMKQLEEELNQVPRPSQVNIDDLWLIEELMREKKYATQFSYKKLPEE